MTTNPASDSTAELLRESNKGLEDARNLLIERSCERMRQITRITLQRNFPGLKRWEDTNDILQLALIRLYKALEEVKPESLRHFYGLAAKQIRWELIDMTRKYFGPKGLAANHDSHCGYGVSDIVDDQSRPESLVEWTEFHELVSALDEEEREIVDLLWYQDLSQDEAARVLQVSVRTIKRRWYKAKIALYRARFG